MIAVEDRSAFDEQVSLVYEELRRLAANVLRGEQRARVTPTTLVHEAWMKLAHSPGATQPSPLHFRRIAARAMRQVLVEAARRRNAARRGSGELLITFDESMPGMQNFSGAKDILALDTALEKLSLISDRQARLVEGRFFGGLAGSESAEMLDVSEATVDREWRSARAWLAREIRHSLAGDSEMTDIKAR